MLVFLLVVALAMGFLYFGKPLQAWLVPGAVGLAAWFFLGNPGFGFWIAAVLFGLAAVGLGFAPIRTKLVTGSVMKAVAPILPVMSETERTALEAGTVWWDRELFSGKPNWKQLLDFQVQELSARERAFLDGPVEELCQMTDDWAIQSAGDLPDEIWSFIKEKGFLGMIIPEEYGGLGFSAAMHSAVVAKLSSRSVAVSVTVMVPNSLGPAELLHHYGTKEQKDHYLPRLADGREVPCFALTEPGAGSDAGSMQSTGVICKGDWEGEEVIGIRLNWDKRYITLSPIATVLGLAFRLRDPDHLIGSVEDHGITCALVPASLPGVETGRRHDPMGVPFHNGPTVGKDVFVPLDAIIGGRDMAGKGWGMLMQSLAAGRGISIPGLSAGASQMTARTVSAYANIRKQFNLEIGRFEGIEEPLARIAGMTYALSAARRLTHGAIDAGEKPSVITAILKAYSTEGMRGVLNDGMDIVAGAGISRGPRNVLAGAYTAIPIGITVEGANILTRSMIIFGQGAIRCHPFAHAEMDSVAKRDLQAFDKAFFGHVGFIATNAMRAFVLGLTRGRIAGSPVDGPMAEYFGQLEHMSASFAYVSDVAMGTLGGTLKFKEKLTGRLADALSWMYLTSTVLKDYIDRGQPQELLPVARWAIEHSLYQTRLALVGFLDNFPIRPLAWKLRLTLFPTGAQLRPPSDHLGTRAARALLNEPSVRAALSDSIFIPKDNEPGLGTLEATLKKVLAARQVEVTMRDAIRQDRLEKKPAATLLDRALEAGIISDGEKRIVMEAEAARDDAIAVDAFHAHEYANIRG